MAAARPQQMNNTVRGGSVPITISYRRVTKRPKIKRTRKFVGWRNVVRNIAIKAIEVVEGLAYDSYQEELEAGESQVVHWALNVEEPWGPSNTARVVAYRTGQDRLPAGAAFEVISIEETPPPPEQTVANRPQNHDQAAKRIREALIKEGHYDFEAGPPPE